MCSSRCAYVLSLLLLVLASDDDYGFGGLSLDDDNNTSAENPAAVKKITDYKKFEDTDTDADWDEPGTPEAIAAEEKFWRVAPCDGFHSEFQEQTYDWGHWCYRVVVQSMVCRQETHDSCCDHLYCCIPNHGRKRNCSDFGTGLDFFCCPDRLIEPHEKFAPGEVNPEDPWATFPPPPATEELSEELYAETTGPLLLTIPALVIFSAGARYACCSNRRVVAATPPLLLD
eukprot:gnl/TRDRNA2_/TRDRNA2_194635_c0_seq1.p1 gnl/TRDRNA2_/TRDRNA2_194635_c0~~gnl/TRDRNA2_/TRDRNA2_194635_c0_seq1.p1  ORF type:complete len:229 (-),score=36.37 gnl/TRDRNA2_/TRDRNA2_194635_c0_seq1:105-791(-)